MSAREVDRETRQAVADVMVRYATGIDRRDWALFRTCFTADVAADYGDLGSWDSVDAIADYMVATHADMGHTMHQLTNIAVTVDGDAATARAYVDAVLMGVDGTSGLQARGFYDDSLVRTVDGWQIAQRRFEVPRVVARVLDPRRAAWYREQGLQTICPTQIAIEQLEQAALAEA